jgi:hypothetical protein
MSLGRRATSSHSSIKRQISQLQTKEFFKKFAHTKFATNDGRNNWKNILINWKTKIMSAKAPSIIPYLALF